MLRRQLLVNPLHLVRQVFERIELFTIGRGYAFPSSLGATQLFDLAHCAMHRSKLALQLRQQIQLERNESFRFPLNKTPHIIRV